jgi:hypothetical protein
MRSLVAIYAGDDGALCFQHLALSARSSEMQPT